MSKEIRFKNKMQLNAFLQKLKLNDLSDQFKKSILDGYLNRLSRKMSQKEYYEHLNGKGFKISLDTIKRIELGRCYSVDMVQIYSQLY